LNLGDLYIRKKTQNVVIISFQEGSQAPG